MTNLTISSNLFFPFPKSLVTEGIWARLTHAERVAFLALTSFADRNGQAWPKRQTILFRSGYSASNTKKISEATGGLSEKVPGFKVVHAKTGRYKTQNTYLLPLPPKEGGRYIKGTMIPLYHDVIKHEVFRRLSPSAKGLYVVLRSESIPPEGCIDLWSMYEIAQEVASFLDGAGTDMSLDLCLAYGRRPFELFFEGNIGGYRPWLAKRSGLVRNTVIKALEELRMAGLYVVGQDEYSGEKHLVRVRAPLPPFDKTWKNGS